MSYVSEAADLFQSLNPDVPVLSPFDYLILAEWEKQEIPLTLVLGAIRELSTGSGTRNHVNLHEIKQDVKDIYAAWLCAQVHPVSAGQSFQRR